MNKVVIYRKASELFKSCDDEIKKHMEEELFDKIVDTTLVKMENIIHRRIMNPVKLKLNREISK